MGAEVAINKIARMMKMAEVAMNSGIPPLTLKGISCFEIFL